MSEWFATERWEQIDRLFAAALEVPAEQRSTFLASACQDDGELQSAVEALLAESEVASPLATAGAASPAILRSLEADLARLDEIAPGSTIGPYRVVRELGRGGMAVVFLAERIDGGFDQQVALKLIKRGLDSSEVLRRFLAERQILASLHHPHIARLLDGGVTENGRPFFAMEWVDGRPIDRYAREESLGLEERLLLFVKVGQAVQAAHQRLVVHRDLKPSNLVVTADGVPKLLDFGIAKLLADEAAERTRTAVRLLTPEFASPEQIRGEAVTTATDVYQLGTLLYLLLTGRNPHADGAASLAEIERAVCERPPPRPSTAITATSRQALAADFGEKAGTPSRWRRKLRGDLDNIVLKALRRVASDRYATVAQLVDDVARALAGQPVSARQPSLWYSTRKFVARNKQAVAAAAVIVLLSIFYTSWLAVERHRARLAAARAEQVAGALENLVGDFDPFQARGSQLTVREWLDRAAANLDRDLNKQPEILIRLQILVGDVYKKLGDYAAARGVLERALQGSEAFYGTSHLTVARAALNLGVVYGDENRFRDAKTTLERALAIFERNPTSPLDLRAETLGRLSRMAWIYRDYEQALALSAEALALRESFHGPEDPAVGSSLLDRADVFLAMGEPQTAIPLLRRAVGLFERTENGQGPHTGQALTRLAKALARSGEENEAHATFERALAVTAGTLGERHPRTLGLLTDFATLLGARGDAQRAYDLLTRALDLCREIHGQDSPTTLRAAAMLGGQLRAMGRYIEARPLYEHSLRTLERSFGPESPHLYPTVVNLAEVILQSGETQEALAQYRRALDLLRRESAPDPAELQSTLRRVAELSVAMGDTRGAASLVAEADDLDATSIATDRADHS